MYGITFSRNRRAASLAEHVFSVGMRKMNSEKRSVTAKQKFAFDCGCVHSKKSRDMAAKGALGAGSGWRGPYVKLSDLEAMHSGQRRQSACTTFDALGT